MKKVTKLLALVLAVVMLFGLLAGCNSNNDPATQTQDNTQAPDNSDKPEESKPAVDVPNRAILGSITELSGDFRFPGWGGSSAGASDQDIGRLTVGYGTMEINQDGEYVWNQTSVKSHTETDNADGSRTYTVEINPGLTYSDGTEVKAADYVVAALAYSSPVCVGAGRSGQSGQAYAGFTAFNAYDGTNEGEPILDADGNETGLVASKVFSGIRLLDDYTFSITIDPSFLPYYFADTYAAADPAPAGLCTGDGVTVQDDGEGCYLSDNFYEKNGDDYVKAAEMAANRYDWQKYPYSGAYTITEWDEGTLQATLTLNPNFKGNFEGQTPSIETLVYIKLIEETQLEQLQSGEVDVLGQITGGDLTTAALALVDGENFSEVHYQRAGYGKVQFECDFGPTMFPEVRQAIAYLLDRVAFCQAFTGGYGVVVDGPYSPDFTMWRAVQDDIDLIDYSFSPSNAVRVLEEGGWVYNSKGEAYVEGQSGVDAVRYKKLTAEEANATDIYGNDAGNKTYASVANTDGVEYKTVEINGEYYMPLAINWFGSQPNSVTDLLSTTLANSSDLAAAGMVIRATTGDFTTLLGNIYRDPSMGYTGTPTYGMLNLATGWNTTVYDYAFNWNPTSAWADYSSNKLIDPYDVAFPYDQAAERLSYEEAVEASGDKLGMDYLSMGMVYNASTEEEFNEWWMAYVERWNELMPDIPLYSNYYYDVYRSTIENFVTTPFFGPAQAIIYANIVGY